MTSKIICAWCGKLLGFKKTKEEIITSNELATHGICSDCEDRQNAILDIRETMETKYDKTMP